MVNRSQVRKVNSSIDWHGLNDRRTRTQRRQAGANAREYGPGTRHFLENVIENRNVNRDGMLLRSGNLIGSLGVKEKHNKLNRKSPNIPLKSEQIAERYNHCTLVRYLLQPSYRCVMSNKAGAGGEGSCRTTDPTSVSSCYSRTLALELLNEPYQRSISRAHPIRRTFSRINPRKVRSSRTPSAATHPSRTLSAATESSRDQIKLWHVRTGRKAKDCMGERKQLY